MTCVKHTHKSLSHSAVLQSI